MCTHLRIAFFSLLATFALTSQAADIQILSAVVKDKPISDAKVIIQRTGDSSKSVLSKANGQASIDTVDDKDTLLIIKKSGYSTLIAKCPCDDFTYALSPVMQNLDGLRVVLTWGQSPKDLDSHLSFPNNHVFFSAKNGTHTNLDVDDTTSYGPETITIEKKMEGQRYVYAVHDYSNASSNNSTAMSMSHARVEVYVGQTMIRSYNAKPNKSATAWIVFGIDETGAFHDIDQYTYLNNDPLKTYLDDIVSADTFETHLIISSATKNSAKRINTQGEKLYHEKKLEEAMYRFQDAINIYPSYGQAYSNLGLTYQKLNRTAEALWANRKAIELASGKNKNRVQASSHYNIARIYEAKEHWQDALNHFQTALSLKQHKAYTKGIKRMQEKLK
jgi:Tetratricopeptide repeat